MGVISNNPGPLAQETTVTQTNEMAVLQNIWMELKVISYILRQAFGVTDSDAAIRNNTTLTDLNNVS